MLTPLALRVISRIRCLNRSRDFGAIVRSPRKGARCLLLAHLRSHRRRPRRLVTDGIPVAGLAQPTVDGCDNLTHAANPSLRSQGSVAHGLSHRGRLVGPVIRVLRQWALNLWPP